MTKLLKFLSKEKKLGLASFIISGAIFLIPAFLGWFNCILPKNNAAASTIILLILFGVIFATVLYIIKACGRSEKYEDCRNKLQSNRTEDKKKFTQWLRHNSVEEYGKQFIKKEQDPAFKEIDDARRNITDCFHYIWDCWRVNDLSMKDLKEIVSGDGADLIINQIEPIEEEIGKRLKKEYKRDMWMFYREYLEDELEDYEPLKYKTTF